MLSPTGVEGRYNAFVTRPHFWCRGSRDAQLQHAVVLGGGMPLEDGLEALAARYYCSVCGVATTSETNLQVWPCTLVDLVPPRTSWPVLLGRSAWPALSSRELKSFKQQPGTLSTGTANAQAGMAWG